MGALASQTKVAWADSATCCACCAMCDPAGVSTQTVLTRVSHALERGGERVVAERCPQPHEHERPERHWVADEAYQEGQDKDHQVVAAYGHKDKVIRASGTE